MLRLGYPVIGVVDMQRAIDFWSAALDLHPKPGTTTERWCSLQRADGTEVVGLQLSESPVEPYPRVHIDLFVDDAAEQEAEIDRLVQLGARRLDWDRYPPDSDFVVLADPDDNPFCIVDMS
ncbi:VOC family protein [Thermocrispum municipale]|jgi:catechol 2,3-dioxygenase-like lactoylglutathione lyase family enzyme|uniref:VOC family protein n=1 Tax=Thermocrispum municipale TaxID=37926 RepID=UPI00048DA51C|nr:VOC family protein [Thermocrispum municipale]